MEATRTWHIQHEFSDCRCDVVCIWYNDNFFTTECNKNQIQAVFRIGSRTLNFECCFHTKDKWWLCSGRILVLYFECLSRPIIISNFQNYFTSLKNQEKG